MSKDNINKNKDFEKMLKNFMKESNRKKKYIRKYHETGHEKKVRAERERKQRQKWNKRRE